MLKIIPPVKNPAAHAISISFIGKNLNANVFTKNKMLKDIDIAR
ncbi:hypothetical protein [Neptunitalea lumnitzerae]|nr:hypothetical protein [Neptunitalea sp. Y10]